MININGYVKNTSGEPIPFASVQVVDGDFNTTGEGAAALGNGYFIFYVNELNEPYALSFSSVGYKPAVVPLTSWKNGGSLTLQPDIKTGENVVVYSTPKPPGTTTKFPVWLALIPLAAIVADKNNGRKISGVTNIYNKLPKWGKTAVLIGGGVVGYKLLKLIFKKKTGSDTVKDTAQELAAQINAGIQPTYNDAQFQAWSEQIITQIQGCDPTYYFPDGFSYSGRLINNIFKQLNNVVDFLKLVTIFGVRKWDDCGLWPFSTNVEGSLFTAIEDELTEGERSRLTTTLQGKGIAYKV